MAFPSPTLQNLTVDGTATLAAASSPAITITGGTVDGTIIGGTTPAAAHATTLSTTGAATLASVATAAATITGGTINGTVIGGTTPEAITATTVTATSLVLPSQTAKEFFAINPLAAYFEQKTYWTRLGPWTWPHSQFARKQEFADPVTDRLDRMGLFYRSVGPEYPREWIPVTLFYNTEEDLVERAIRSGERLLCLFGPGWTYTKTQDYRDWYLVRDEASLILHNLTAAPMNATVNITGAAVEGSVTLSSPSATPAVFPPNQILARSIDPVSLAPGRNEIPLSIRSGSQPGTALLVQRTSAAEASPPPP